jgi:hypothetical protein
MQRKDSGLIDLGGMLDPDVAAAIGQGRQRQEIRQRTKAQETHAEKDAARNRRMIDLDPDLERRLESMAGDLMVPVSSLIGWLLENALAEVDLNCITDDRVPSRSMRFQYILRYQKKRKSKK